jgi:hypothetical protein
LHSQALELGATNSVELEQQAVAAELMVARLDTVLPKLDDLLRKEAAEDYARVWRVKRDRAMVARETMAKRLAHYQQIAAQLITIFEEALYLDEKIIGPVNESRPGNEAPLQTCELYLRKLERFTRDRPSLLDQVRLPDFEQSERFIWPKKTQNSIGVLVAAAMTPPYHPGDRWYEQQAEKRAEQEAEHQRMTAYYAEQQRLKEQREQHEDALLLLKSASGISLRMTVSR